MAIWPVVDIARNDAMIHLAVAIVIEYGANRPINRQLTQSQTAAEI